MWIPAKILHTEKAVQKETVLLEVISFRSRIICSHDYVLKADSIMLKSSRTINGKMIV